MVLPALTVQKDPNLICALVFYQGKLVSGLRRLCSLPLEKENGSMNKLLQNQVDPFKHADVLFKYSSNAYLFSIMCIMLPSEIRYMTVKQNCQNNNLGFFV